MMFSLTARVLTLVLLAFALLGCASQPKPPVQIVYKTQYIYPSVPKELLTQVTPNPPVSSQVYLQMPVYQREGYLTDYVVDLLGTVAVCNKQLTQVEDYLNKVKQGEGLESQPQDKRSP